MQCQSNEIETEMISLTFFGRKYLLRIMTQQIYLLQNEQTDFATSVANKIYSKYLLQCNGLANIFAPNKNWSK